MSQSVLNPYPTSTYDHMPDLDARHFHETAGLLAAQRGGLPFRFLGIVLAIAAVFCGSPGCTSKTVDRGTYTVWSTLRLTDEETARKNVLNDAEQKAIREAFHELAAGQTVQDAPRSSRTIRWSDVPLAVYYACDDQEIAIVRTKERNGGFEFELRTIEDYPGRLLITPTNDANVYEAEATIGWMEDHADRADRLLKAIQKQMGAFSRKRSFSEP